MRAKSLVTAAALATGVLASPGTDAQALIRLAADFFKFDGTEFVTATTAVNGTDDMPGTPDGALFYRKTVTVAPQSNTLFVSIYATGDVHSGAAEWLSCRVNGAFCRPSSPVAVDEAPNGWISLLKLPQDVESPDGQNNCNDGGGGSADCHDNGIVYQWCVAGVRGGQNVTVDLKMATSITGSLVFIEKGHVYIDSADVRGANQCTEAPPLTSASSLSAPGRMEEIAGSTKRGTQEQ